MHTIQQQYPRATRRGYSTTTLEAVVLALMSLIPIFAVAAANRGSVTASRHSTERFGSVAGLPVVRHRMDVSMPAGAAAAGTQLASSRTLLYANHNHSKSPTCALCWLYRQYQGYFYGHCKSGGQLYNCGKPVQSTNSKSAALALPKASPQKGAGPFATAVPASAREADLAATAPFVSCFKDSDCALPADDFPPYQGTAPLSIGGTLSATCRRPSFVNDPTFAKFPGICMCTYPTPASPPAVIELLSTCDSAAANLLGLDGLTLDGNPFSSFFRTDYCIQGQGRGPGGVVDDRPFFVPGPEPIDENEDPSLPGPPEGTVSDPNLYDVGVVIEDAYVLINDTTAAIENPDGEAPDPVDMGPTPSGCTDAAKCAPNNRPCAGLAVEMPLALPCCSGADHCVRTSSTDEVSVCLTKGIPLLPGWSVLPCGTPYNAGVP